MRNLQALPSTYAASRANLHRLAVYVISPARRRHNPRAVALTPTPGGFGTAPYGPRGTVLRVEGASLVLESPDGLAVTPITSLNAAAAFAGIDADLAQEDTADVPPAGDPDATLVIDADATRRLGDWFAFAYELLEEFRASATEEDAPSAVRIWPEHFDASLEIGPEGARGTYGASPGDLHHATPYLYASPWSGTLDDPFFNAEWFSGAALPYASFAGVADPSAIARAFYRTARDHIQRS